MSQFEGKRAYEHVRKLAVDIGPRMMGTEGDRKGADYIRDYFKSLGLSVSEQSFEVASGSIIEHRVEVIEPTLGVINAFPVLLTPDTPPEGVTSDLVYIEGTDSPQVGPHLEGKIVLGAIGGGGDLAEGLRRIVRQKPAALIAMAGGPGVSPKQFEFTEKMTKPFPLVTIFMVSLEDAMKMVQKGAKKVKVLLRSQTGPQQTRNIIAELKGTTNPDEIVVIGGHLDTTPNLPGAQDNAAGTAIVMELARLYAERGSKRTIRFVGWAGEEGGLYGSRHYVDELVKADKAQRKAEGFVEKRDQTEWDQHRLAISVDVAGMVVGWNLVTCLGPAELGATMKVLSKELGIPHQVGEGYYGSDHLPFAASGLPAMGVFRGGPTTQYMHGPEDAIDLIHPDRLEEVGKYLDAFLARNVANAEAFPFERKVPENLQKETLEHLKTFGEEPEAAKKDEEKKEERKED